MIKYYLTIHNNNGKGMIDIIKSNDYVLRDPINSTNMWMFTVGILQAINESTSVDIPIANSQILKQNDCVDQKKAIEIVGQMGKLPWELAQQIREMTAADVYEVKHAMWLNDKGEYAPLDEYSRITDSVHCSNCGEWLEGSSEYRLTAIYCPCCGAKMDEEMSE